jgi:CRISPR-associated protein Cst1
VKNQQNNNNTNNNNTNNNNTNNQLILYPSNWIYNASVIGLLKVLDWINKVLEWIHNVSIIGLLKFPDSIHNAIFIKLREVLKACKISFNINKTVSIDKSSIKSAYKGIFNYHQQKLKENFYIWGKNNRYPNYIQYPQKDFFEKYYIPSLEKISKSNTKKCSWCSGYFITQNILDNLKGKFKGKFDQFIDQREKFQAIHFSALGARITKTPNFFWNSNYSIPICHLCSFLIIFNHLAFIKTEEGEIFINAPDFELIWDLNQFVENILNKHKDYNTRKILGISLLQWAIKRRTLLSSWTMMNIELIIKKQNNIDYFELPTNITKILLDYEIANLINDISEEEIFDLILAGKFSELEKATYFTLKAIIKLINQENINENDPIKQYIKKCDDLKHLKEIASKLPTLYAKILNKLINREENMGETNSKNYYKEKNYHKENIDELVESLKLEGSKVSSGVSEAINNIAYKLLEQVRLNNKDNVYYILLRCFYSNQEKFPDKLVSAFKPENDKYFKTLIFSFLAHILSNTKKNQDKHQDNRQDNQDNQNNQDSNEYL